MTWALLTQSSGSVSADSAKVNVTTAKLNYPKFQISQVQVHELLL